MLNDIDPQLIRRIKLKMKQPAHKEQVKLLVKQLSRADLQNRVKIKQTFSKIGRILNEPIPTGQADFWANWIIAQRIDPNNRLHLIRLWSLFR